MAKFDMKVTNVDKSKMLNAKIKKVMQGAVLDVVLDLKRVASSSAPHLSGYLEKNAQHEFKFGSQVEGTVGFSAIEKGFNYAEWAHNATYQLGEKSKRKSGGRSKFGSGTVPVGRGYLKNALEMNKPGYMKYLEAKYKEATK